MLSLSCLFCAEPIRASVITTDLMDGRCQGCGAQYGVHLANGCVWIVEVKQCGEACVCDERGRAD